MPQADWIYLSKIGFPCIVGMHDDEQLKPQRLEVELAMGLDLDGAAGGDLTRSVHYVAALDQVQFIAQEGRWHLLESLAAAIARHLLREPAEGEGRAALERVRVRVGKPAYLRGRAQPAVEIQRDRSWAERAFSAPGRSEVRVLELQTTRQSGAYHLELGAGALFAIPDSTSAFVISGNTAKKDGSVLARGAVARGGESVQNAGTSAGRLLLVGRPLAT
jgi:FolB domain-containing protein